MRLVIADNNRILGDALGAVLQDCEHEVVAVVSTADDCVAAVTACKPDVCLLDVRIPRLEDGLRAIRELRGQSPATAVVVLSDLSDRQTWSQPGNLEIAGLVTKDRSVSQVVAALDAVMDGEVVLDQGPWTKPLSTTVAADLTPREAEVLHRMIAGQDTRRMASEMNVTVSTLRTYVKNVLAKLGVHSRLEAVALASRENLPYAALPAQRPAQPSEQGTPPFDVAAPRQAGILR
jgi:two-component system, NarL family, nitrate/nitrite response regulator NarL